VVKCASPRAQRGEASSLVSESPEDRELGSDASGRAQRWQAFLLGEDPRDRAVRREDWAIGDDQFRLRVAQAGGRPIPRGRGRARK
jgi:hypothetical protein